MSRVRILGPRGLLPRVLTALQDAGTLHLAEPAATPATTPVALTRRQAREEVQLKRALDDVEHVLGTMHVRANGASPAPAAALDDLARWARLAGRLRRELDRLDTQLRNAREEQALIQKYQRFFSAFRSLLESEKKWPNAMAYHVLLKSDPAAMTRLRASLAAVVGEDFQIFSQPLPSGETAVLIVIAAHAAGRIERLLAEAQVQEIPVPKQFGGGSLADAIPRMLARQGDLPQEIAAIERAQTALARQHGEDLVRARRALHDRLAALRAIGQLSATSRAFVLEGWVPQDGRRQLAQALAPCGDDVVLSEIAREAWSSVDAPVVLRNPRLLRPFEALIALMPLPRYGTIDPTPFVAVFFPAFFGIMMGDIGYGALLMALSLLLRHRSKPGTMWHDVAEIGGACGLFGLLGGVLFGEFFGDLGHRLFGLAPLWFSREQALIPFLLLAVTLGTVHVLLGLVLGAVSSVRHHPRQALGRGVSALMLVLIGLALLATAGVLPRGFFTPSVIALLVAFPVLIAAEGIVAPIELLSTIGNILSYARIMALGVASVMLAVVANQMLGGEGSIAVGIVFALLFHAVNFAIALFSPTIHALRLHYVEFFGKFYSPGGVRYQPFGRWVS